MLKASCFSKIKGDLNKYALNLMVQEGPKIIQKAIGKTASFNASKQLAKQFQKTIGVPLLQIGT